MNSQDYKYITCKVEDRIATVVINRPEVSNAIDRDVLAEIQNAFKWCDAADEVGVIVLTGAGKNFSAGGNLKSFKVILDSGGYIHKEELEYAAEVSWDIHTNSKPTIAMINGAAVGAGASIAAACDFRVFGASSRFIMAFINVGLSGDSGSIYYLTKLVGVAKSMEIMMTGDPVGAEEAMKIGLANKTAEDDKLSEATYQFAKKFARGPSFAYRCQKDIFSKIFYPDHGLYSKIECQYLEDCSKNPDFKEAVDAFIEKRQPVFAKK